MVGIGSLAISCCVCVNIITHENQNPSLLSSNISATIRLPHIDQLSKHQKSPCLFDFLSTNSYWHLLRARNTLGFQDCARIVRIGHARRLNLGWVPPLVFLHLSTNLKVWFMGKIYILSDFTNILRAYKNPHSLSAGNIFSSHLPNLFCTNQHHLRSTTTTLLRQPTQLKHNSAVNATSFHPQVQYTSTKMAYILDIITLNAALEKLTMEVDHSGTTAPNTMDTNHDSGLTTPDDMKMVPITGTTTPDTRMKVAIAIDDTFIELTMPEDMDLEMSSSKISTPDIHDFDMCSIPETSSPASTFSFEMSPFIDRSLKTRNARMANAILALDEDVPMDVDDSIKTLFENHKGTKSSSIDYLTDDNYLDYKELAAAKKAATPALPKSKRHQAYQAPKSTPESILNSAEIRTMPKILQARMIALRGTSQ